MKKKLIILMALVLAFSLLVGCGGDTKPAESTEGEAPAETTEAATSEGEAATEAGAEVAETSAEDGAPVDGGELTIGLSANIAHLDPIKYTALYESNVMRSVYNTLVVYNEDMTQIMPSLATEWSISEDLLNYTFKLRDDVYFQAGKFQEGRKMVAEDVKYSLLRSLNDSAMNRVRYIQDITVNSETELVVTLERPYSPFLVMLTDMGNAIVPQEEVEGHGDDFGRNPVGTGPFQFVEWQADSYVRLERHDKYWGDKPHLDSVRFNIITDGNMMGNSLQSGDIDMATQLSGQNVELIKKNDKLVLDQIPGLSIGYFAFNLTEGPTADLKVRQAMNWALNREELVAGVYKFGEAKPLYLPLPSASWGFSDEAAEIVKSSSGGDVEKAKALLAEAGYPDGFDLELYCAASRVPAATIVQAQMQKIGINVSINSVEWGTFSDIVSQGKAQSYIMGWSWYPDPDFFLFQMLHSNQIGALGNGGGYNNPEVDKILDEATSVTSDQAERTQMYGEALKLIAADLPHLDLYDQDVITGLSNRVKGYTSRPDQTIIIVGDGVNVWLED
ncbi:MAG: ABC transporter substrate-binding protein [Tissierellia bacterium]|nr:ABC transporter substrate-binding protein [Tissierellia bacterium]